MAILLVAALLAGTAGIFFNVAFNAFLPHVVAAEDLLEGNSKLQTSASVAAVIGPGLGGLLAQAVGAVSGLLIDSFTFLMPAGCLLALRPAPEPRSSACNRPGMLRQIAEGMKFIMHGRLLQAMLMVAAVTNFAMLGITALRVVFLVSKNDVAPGTARVVIGVGSLGSILGAALALACGPTFWQRSYLPGVEPRVGAVHSPAAPRRPRLTPDAVRGRHLHHPCRSHDGGRDDHDVPRQLRSPAPAGSCHRSIEDLRVRHHTARCGNKQVSGLCARGRGCHVGLGALYVVTPLLLLATPARTLRDFPVRSTQDAVVVE